MSKKLDSITRKTFNALYDYFNDPESIKLVLLPEGMKGTDCAVLCKVANSVIHDGQIDYIQTTAEGIGTAITNFFDAKKLLMPDLCDRYVHILALGFSDIDFDILNDLEIEGYNIVVTDIPCKIYTSAPFVDGAAAVVDNRIHANVFVAGWHTGDSPLTELASFITELLTNYGKLVYRDTIDVVKKFCKSSGRAGDKIKADFVKYPVNIHWLINGDINLNIFPVIWPMFTAKTVHTMFYNYANRTDNIPGYVDAMAEWICNGKLYGDKGMADTIRGLGGSRTVTDSVYYSTVCKIDTAKMSSSDRFLDTALRYELKLYIDTLCKIRSNTVGLADVTTRFAGFRGLNFRIINNPGIVIHTADLNEHLEYENSAYKFIMKMLNVCLPCDDHTVSANRKVRSIPIATDDGGPIYTDKTAGIGMIIKCDPNSNKFKIIINDRVYFRKATDMVDILKDAIDEFNPDNDCDLYSTSVVEKATYDLSDPDIIVEGRDEHDDLGEDEEDVSDD